jgi:hypothetical protein
MKVERHRRFETVAVQLRSWWKIPACHVVTHPMQIDGDTEIGERGGDEIGGLAKFKFGARKDVAWPRFCEEIANSVSCNSDGLEGGH